MLEVWERYGRVEVPRDERGRFISWHKVVSVAIGKQIAVYGNANVDGKVSSRRYEFSGGGRDLYRAVVLALEHPPKRRFTTVSAREFSRNPSKYAGRGYWIDKPEVVS